VLRLCVIKKKKGEAFDSSYVNCLPLFGHKEKEGGRRGTPHGRGGGFLSVLSIRGAAGGKEKGGFSLLCFISSFISIYLLKGRKRTNPERQRIVSVHQLRGGRDTAKGKDVCSGSSCPIYVKFLTEKKKGGKRAESLVL